MRIAVSLAIFVLACFALTSAQTTTSNGSTAIVQKASLTAGESTITGCIKGSTDQFYLVEQDGTTHLLMGRNRTLRPYLDHWVELGGNRDNNRDASASSDEGTPHGLRFFQVENVLADQGSCKR
jgi:hypothetical protein